ncbi:SIR2 family protein [Agreia sp. VKM Ac-1783]|uniref:SIR2 family protein n=1 Tax=Agreia sp. VKM Ac-1783 TaxID=1938889 RepID=UPI000A2AC74B|nr:SIR2 family protein [Agreia sp. VKM Ac-1783]SMQ71914.1 SIR2-like domain-containing protein [Agreia sp. VKM Ac-1783]
MTNLISEFSAAVRGRRAAIFVGAGLSKPAGLPGWDDLIGDARTQASVPPEVTDAPLAAEYIVEKIGEKALYDSLLGKLPGAATPTPLHHRLVKLPVYDYWTTNYDLLLEKALDDAADDAARIVKDEDLGSQVTVGEQKQLFKMHGSLINPEGDAWEVDPTLTRTHFETYEVRHPRFWAQLRAQFLTRSFLFLGLSFEDPNVNVLLRLARSLQLGSGPTKHFAIMRRESKPLEQALQTLRINDLKNGGIHVHLIDDFLEQDEILGRIETLTRRPNVFVSGSSLTPGAETVASQVATRLADEPGLGLLSFGGEAALLVGSVFKEALDPGTYRPERIRHYYRKGAELEIKERIGTAIFTDMELDAMREYVIPLTRAMIVFGGGDRTLEEAEVARMHHVAVIPVGTTGGAAQQIWEKYESQPEELNLPLRHSSREWQRLMSTEPAAVQAVHQIIRASMFE